jgi:hypothetical protein
MDNPETKTTLGTRHRTSQAKLKTKQMSNMSPTKETGMNQGACEG